MHPNKLNIKEEKTARLLSQVLPYVDETWLNGKSEEGKLSRLSIDAQNEEERGGWGSATVGHSTVTREIRVR